MAIALHFTPTPAAEVVEVGAKGRRPAAAWQGSAMRFRGAVRNWIRIGGAASVLTLGLASAAAMSPAGASSSSLPGAYGHLPTPSGKAVSGGTASIAEQPGAGPTYIFPITPASNLTAYLATSPGGADSVAIIAASSSHVDVPFVMAMQMARFILVLLVGPALARAVARWTRS